MTRLKLVLAVVAALLLSGCEFSVYKMPLPGGVDVGDNPVNVTVRFPDVLDLVPQSSVKVDDVTVGKVTDVRLDGYQAVVELALKQDTGLPDNALAEIRQTSLLGEKFVSLDAPENPSPNKLSDGDVIGVERTNRNPEVEEVLGALSLVLNGGGVAQLKTIASELNIALEGREGAARSVLTQLRVFMEELDENKADIVQAIESVNRLAISLNGQEETIESALDNLPAALASLDSQREDLVKMLDALAQLSDVGTRVIKASKTATIDALNQLQPVLTQLAASGDDLAKSLQVIYAYPFIDAAVGENPNVARNLHMGDFTNLSIQLDLNLAPPGSEFPDIPSLPPVPVDCTPLSALQIPPGTPLSEVDLSQLCQGARDALNRCLTNPSTQTCGRLPGALVGAVCSGLPIPNLCPARNSEDQEGGLLGLPLPNLDGLGGPGGLGSLGRAPVGADAPPDGTATLSGLMDDYHPVLVSMLLPGVAQ